MCSKHTCYNNGYTGKQVVDKGHYIVNDLCQELVTIFFIDLLLGNLLGLDTDDNAIHNNFLSAGYAQHLRYKVHIPLLTIILYN